jgi:hypothetical protein
MRLRIDSAPRSSETGLASPHLCLGRHHNGDAGNETIPNETDSEPRAKRIQSRERSRPQACGSERPQQPAPWQPHANRIQRPNEPGRRPARASGPSGQRLGSPTQTAFRAANEADSEPRTKRIQSRERSGAPAPRERAVPARIHPPRAKRAAPGTDTSVPPHCGPISPTHRSRGRRCLSPAPEATARAERPEPSPATCSFATFHRLPDAHHLRSLPETRCFPALAQKLCLFPQFRFGCSRCTTTPRLNRSLRPEFCRIPSLRRAGLARFRFNRSLRPPF